MHFSASINLPNFPLISRKCAGDISVSERDKPPPKKKAKTKVQGGIAGQEGAIGGVGAGDGVSVKGKAKAKASAANGRNAGALPHSNRPSGYPSGQMSGAAAPRLGYGPKMSIGQGKQVTSKGLGGKQGSVASASLSHQRPAQPQHPGNTPQPGPNFKSGQGLPNQGGPANQSGQVPAPIRVRQAFKWTYNLRKKPIDKTRIRRSFAMIRSPSSFSALLPSQR